MAHHGLNPDENVFDEETLKELRAKLLKEFMQPKPRKYPDGRLGAEDDGELEVAITNKNGRVLMHFGKQIEWIGFTAEQAVEIAKCLFEHSNKAAEIEHK